MVSASPFCPPADPPDLIRSRASSRLKSSQTNNRSHKARPKKSTICRTDRPLSFMYLCGAASSTFSAPKAASDNWASKRSRGFPAPKPHGQFHHRPQTPHCAASVRTSGRDFQAPQQPSRDNLHASVRRPASRASIAKRAVLRPWTWEFESGIISSLFFSSSSPSSVSLALRPTNSGSVGPPSTPSAFSSSSSMACLTWTTTCIRLVFHDRVRR